MTLVDSGRSVFPQPAIAERAKQMIGDCSMGLNGANDSQRPFAGAIKTDRRRSFSLVLQKGHSEPGDNRYQEELHVQLQLDAVCGELPPRFS